MIKRRALAGFAGLLLLCLVVACAGAPPTVVPSVTPTQAATATPAMTVPTATSVSVAPTATLVPPTATVPGTATAIGVSTPLTVTTPTAPAQPDEGWVISQFDAAIAVQSDGSLRVVESTLVDFGSQQKHGIYRNIPVVYSYDQQNNRVYDLTVESVTDRNGQAWKYTASREGSNEVLKIGDPNKTISGAQSYRITYRVRGALNAFPDRDELYWNVNGQWPARTQQVIAGVTLPKGEVQGVACYQGVVRSTDTCRGSGDGAAATFQSTRPLSVGEHMTIVVSIPKGVVPEPKPILEPLSGVNLVVGGYMIKPMGGSYIYIKGEVLNKGTTDAGNVRIAVTFFDAQGRVMAADSTGTYYPLVRAGGKAPFYLPITRAPSNWKDIRFQVQGQPYKPSGTDYLDFTVKGVSIQPPRNKTDDYSVAGLVVNTGSRTATGITVIVIAYDAQGRVIEIQDGGATLSEIPPSGEASFSIRLAQPKPIKVPASCEVFVRSR